MSIGSRIDYILAKISGRFKCFFTGHQYMRVHSGEYKDQTYAIYVYQCQQCFKVIEDEP